MESIRDFMGKLATSIGKKPEDMEPFIKTYYSLIINTLSFEDNWFDTVDAVRSITDDQWS